MFISISPLGVLLSPSSVLLFVSSRFAFGNSADIVLDCDENETVSLFDDGGPNI